MENGWRSDTSQRKDRVTVLSEMYTFRSVSELRNGTEGRGRCSCRERLRECSDDCRRKTPTLEPEVGLRPRHQRKLILHFDVRNTVLVADSVWSVNVEQALNSYLCGVTWGRVGADGSWQWVSEKPSLKPPESNSITYYKYLEKQIVKKGSDRSALRQLTGDFTSQQIGERFFPYFRFLLKHLEWKNSTTDESLTMAGKDGKPYHYLLPSFLHLIYYLKQKRRDFAIVIRTYGADAPYVLAAVQKTVQGGHPEFTEAIDVDVNITPGTVVRAAQGHIQFERKVLENDKSDISRTEIYSTEQGIYRMLCDSSGVTGYVDHFEFWEENNFHHLTSKPLWIRPSDRHIQHIFFDDNIRVMEEDSIVDLRMLDGGESCQGRSMSMAEAAVYENVCLVQADLLESTHNKSYFIDKLDLCEQNYDTFLTGLRQMNQQEHQLENGVL